MRISVTDRCNLRCSYCMPRDLEMTEMSNILTFEEIIRVVEAATSLGITQFRITGGEPLARRGVTDLIRMIRQTPGVERVMMTTNGVQLSDHIAELKDAGLDGINLSLDVLDAESFRNLTGRDFFAQVTAGIDAALASGIPLKLNSVSLPQTDPAAMVRFAEARNLPIRFIEMMPIGSGADFVGRSNKELIEELEKTFGPAEFIRKESPEKADPAAAATAGSASADPAAIPATAGPAAYYRFPEVKHPVGFISALSKKFCGSCNRVRLTSEGYLKLCLCYGDGIDLRDPLRAGVSKDELADTIRAAVLGKPAEHCFEHTKEITEQHGMSQLGG